MPLITLKDLLAGRSGGNSGDYGFTQEIKLPDSVITHDFVDQMEFGNYKLDSPRFRKVAVENAPHVPPNVPDPDPIDFTAATPDEIKVWQQAARAAKAARDDAPAYTPWEKLTRDVFFSYHSHDQPEIIDEVDPGVELHKRILPKAIHTDDHAQSRNMTRDDAPLSAMATMAFVKTLKEVLEEELVEQARQAQEFDEAREQCGDASDALEDLRGQARDLHNNGQPIPQGLIDKIKGQVAQRQAALKAAQQIAANPTPMSAGGMQAIAQAAKAGKAAADAAAGLPSFGSGLGQGEPVYDSPEQALSIAEMWANNPQLRAMAQLFGRLDPDMRFQRSKRIIGGQDEIVDVHFDDNLARVLPGELALFADPDFEDDFLVRYCAKELLCFSTVGEEHAGRGPMGLVLDGSWSMQGERNIWARAIAMVLLHIARLEKRDFFCVEFSGGDETAAWMFPAKARLDAQLIVDMASHFFGGGTTPIVGVTAAAKIMADVPAFRKADLVLVGDGEAGYGPEDERLRSQLTEMGVRLFGLAIGSGDYKYLTKYCESVVGVHDFELQDPSKATAELATHIT